MPTPRLSRCLRNSTGRAALNGGVTSEPAVGQLRFVAVGQDDPLAVPLIDELAVEYADRYGGNRTRVHTWLRSYPSEEFDPPDGGLFIGLLDDEPVTGGAFRRFDDTTAELKRIWTVILEHLKLLTLQYNLSKSKPPCVIKYQ